MNDPDALLAHYAEPGVLTDVGSFGAEIDALSGNAADVAAFVQGLLIHDGLTGLYGVEVPAGRAGERQLHGASAMLAQARRLDDRPLAAPRAPGRRVAGVCRHFATLFVAVMRRKGVPARARCGFANYFEPSRHLDHWVGEYWNAAEGRWVLTDAQIDNRQRKFFKLTLDPLDVPRDRFLVGGDAWQACRTGADPMTFGVAGTKMWGLVEVYGDLFQDLAALQKIELLPWGWYGLATDESGLAETDLLDRLAAISSAADADAMVALEAELAADERLRAPSAAVASALEADRIALAGR